MMISAVVFLLLRQIKQIREWIKGTGWQPGWISGVLAGFLSGIFGGEVSIPGPPMIIYGVRTRRTTGFRNLGYLRGGVKWTRK